MTYTQSPALELGNYASEHQNSNKGHGSPQDHKDSMHRYNTVNETHANKDHYLDPDDGKLKLLRVQVAPKSPDSKPPYPNELPNSWDRPEEVNPFKAFWRVVRRAPREIMAWTYDGYGNKRNGTGGALSLYYKYPIASFGLTLTSLFGEIEGDVLLGGRYAPVRYEYFCYPKVARNEREGKPPPEIASNTSTSTTAGISHLTTRADREEEIDGVFGRHIRPRYLCIIDDDPQNPEGYRCMDVDYWDSRRPERISGGYVFVSYTRAQFRTNKELSDTDMYKSDLNDLVAIGTAAARTANLRAFWIDVICLDGPIADFDSHRICDIARGADRMVIAVKGDCQARLRQARSAALDVLLRSWASRLWTLPELLLAPTRHDLAIYQVRTTDGSSTATLVDVIPKRNMAERAYGKHKLLVRQLVDHFESTLHLTQTELLTIGLECLLTRQFNEYWKADPIYALMTLARRRPIPNEKQTLFEAFAQLSLLNDSNMLLERLICILPPFRGTPWSDFRDFWGAKLWDIAPNVQVAAITEGESVLIDGAFGASIEWEALKPVGFVKRRTIWRKIGNFLIRIAPLWFMLAAGVLSTTARPETIPIESDHYYNDYYYYEGTRYVKRLKPIAALGIILFVIAIAIFFSLPAWVRGIYGGKFWSTQAHLIGLEGVADLEWIEYKLFGLCEGRLKWAANASTQSQHQEKTQGKFILDECEATEPVVDDIPKADPAAKLDPDRLFTLVDTYSMTAMVFRAVHPPSVALVCGQEGGMRRALLCSYDYRTQSFHRETVVRMPTKVLDRMDRVNKFRFSMQPMPLHRKGGRR